MAKPKKAGVERKKKIEDLPVRDVETAEARTIAGGKASLSELKITKRTDVASPNLMIALAASTPTPAAG